MLLLLLTLNEKQVKRFCAICDGTSMVLEHVREPWQLVRWFLLTGSDGAFRRGIQEDGDATSCEAQAGVHEKGSNSLSTWGIDSKGFESLGSNLHASFCKEKEEKLGFSVGTELNREVVL